MTTRKDDESILNMLHHREVIGFTASGAAERFGMTRGAVLGIEKRIRDDSAKHPCACKKPENRDGGMPVK